MIIEIILYILFYVLIFLNMHISYFPNIALFYGTILSIMYFFAFSHWFKTEKNIPMQVIGRIVMSMIPVALVFAYNCYPGKFFIVFFSLIVSFLYWIIRYRRKTMNYKASQIIWLYFLLTFPAAIAAVYHSSQ